MDDAELQRAILHGLLPWRWLPETDLLRRLPPAQAVRYRREVLDRLVSAGLVTSRTVGDERIIALTEAGERSAAGREREL
jgi:hypothetical protein